ncbi:ATP NAD kinase [Pyricularia oryzae 70-15]|uniref:ATP NAD kinase n=1 Tax=Pyricularia oryzae (strain 70-15 / ATCC MYA-4617 / FGSC 8958) TaxID=242507 RepID=G4MYU2_PYRO7|nr:ATP NAD kinase [Pyricularia oryzae 70-15]EHA55321.1 ATP NAD kinase [Pyricularia oryzae 70-15]KAI7924469.1 ATP NAD kinase [Pyricularia oryzae]KAI7926235.1 ATP NAD kinase [Pyricularia oryzae]
MGNSINNDKPLSPFAEKHISFDDGHSSASDEDQKAVEVLFDPTNPYRRKSSLVASEATLTRPRRAPLPTPDKAQCIVHQLIESQRKLSEGSNQNSQDHGPHNAVTGDRQKERRKGRSSPLSQALHPSVEQGGDKAVDPVGTSSRESSNGTANPGLKRRFDYLEAPSDSSDAGQVDEHHWRHRISKSQADIDMAGPSADLPEVLHSRLLTKKQLSEMAWGVRELSRRLGSMRLKFRVKSIFLLTKIYDEDLIPKTRELTRWLLDKDRDVKYTVWVERSLKENKKFDALGLLNELQHDYQSSGDPADEEGAKGVSRRLRYWDENICRTRPHTFDFVITLGGDGTVLYASWLFQRIVPPVLSFALGSLGFLTKFDFDEHKDILTTAFNHGVTVSLRLRFEGTIMRSTRQKKVDEAGNSSAASDESTSPKDERVDAEAQKKRDLVEELIGEEKDDEHTHRPDGTYEILNEVVIDRGPNPTMSYLEIFGDDEHFTSVLADGICVSTPTGSTAYNLASGGSLCHPENPVMLVTSICPHTLSFRPIILPDTIVLRVGVPYGARTGSWASFDGRERIELHPGDYVTISASRYPFASVQAPGRRSEDWVNSISAKLGWNTRQKQKAFSEWQT